MGQQDHNDHNQSDEQQQTETHSKHHHGKILLSGTEWHWYLRPINQCGMISQSTFRSAAHT
jgi:hypothetical protein